MEKETYIPNYFVGLKPSAEYIHELAQVAGVLSEPWQPTHEKDFHLTLQYLGQIAEKDLPLLETIVDCIASDFGPVRLDNGRAVVMRPNKPYMTWVRFANNTWLRDILREVERRCKQFVPHDMHGRTPRTPIPHITLARTPRGVYADSLVPEIEIPEKLTEVLFGTIGIWRSREDRLDQAYELVHSWELQ